MIESSVFFQEASNLGVSLSVLEGVVHNDIDNGTGYCTSVFLYFVEQWFRPPTVALGVAPLVTTFFIFPAQAL